MKLEGSTALSVDIKTIASALNFLQVSAIILVPSVFVLMASIGWFSQIGTCFKAAVCKIILGLYFSNNLTTAFWSLTSKSTEEIFLAEDLPVIDSVIFHKANSEKSDNIKLLGCISEICLHNSLPIVPPAPVTRTVFL